MDVSVGTRLRVLRKDAGLTQAQLAALADSSGDASIQRADEPYRRALSQIYARLSTTHLALTGGPAPLPAQFEAPAYQGPDAFRADLAVLHDSLIRTHGAVFADDRLARLITAADIFGFHMATLDLRQNSDVHERTVAELLEADAEDALARRHEARVACDVVRG